MLQSEYILGYEHFYVFFIAIKDEYSRKRNALGTKKLPFIDWFKRNVFIWNVKKLFFSRFVAIFVFVASIRLDEVNITFDSLQKIENSPACDRGCNIWYIRMESDMFEMNSNGFQIDFLRITNYY